MLAQNNKSSAMTELTATLRRQDPATSYIEFMGALYRTNPDLASQLEPSLQGKMALTVVKSWVPFH